ncbi:MAG: SDR family oxidoreductase [Candidatus Hydrogenedentes bacterium]|nr:SDR family oxidoreductase [Candidatus Hydrogenedentota bacterium]
MPAVSGINVCRGFIPEFTGGKESILSEGNTTFDLTGKVAVVSGGGGVLGSAITCGLARAGAQCAVTDISLSNAEQVASQITAMGGRAKGYELNVMADGATEAFCDQVYAEFGKVDILVNCVGGNMKEATTSPEMSFFDVPLDAIRKVMELNFTSGVVRPCQVFCRKMKDNPDGGSIINVSSMSSMRPLTRILGYSAAKAAVSNFTQWLAVHLAKEHSTKLRVNALAPGFFLTAQNRYLLTDERTGELTERGNLIIQHTPMGDFGVSEDLVGATIWLASDASRFVNGIVLPIDGGFSAFSGV